MAELEAALEASGRGDHDAFGRVYDALAPRVLGLMARVVGDPARSQDLARDAFVEAWRRSSRFDRREASATAWLLGIAHRLAVAERRSARGPETHAVPPLDSPESPGRPDQRALGLAYYEARTHSEIAALMGLAPGGAAALITSALAPVGRAGTS